MCSGMEALLQTLLPGCAASSSSQQSTGTFGRSLPVFPWEVLEPGGSPTHPSASLALEGAQGTPLWVSPFWSPPPELVSQAPLVTNGENWHFQDMIQCPVPPVPSDGVLALHSGHVGWALGVSLSLMALPDSPSPPERDEAASTNHGGASPLEQVTFKQRSRKSHQAVGKATGMFLPQAGTGTRPSPTAVPVRARNLPGVPRTFQRSCFGSFGCHGLCWGLVLTEMRMLREQSPQGWAGSHCWWSHPQPPQQLLLCTPKHRCR